MNHWVVCKGPLKYCLGVCRTFSLWLCYCTMVMSLVMVEKGGVRHCCSAWSQAADTVEHPCRDVQSCETLDNISHSGSSRPGADSTLLHAGCEGAVVQLNAIWQESGAICRKEYSQWLNNPSGQTNKAWREVAGGPAAFFTCCCFDRFLGNVTAGCWPLNGRKEGRKMGKLRYFIIPQDGNVALLPEQHLAC